MCKFQIRKANETKNDKANVKDIISIFQDMIDKTNAGILNDTEKITICIGDRKNKGFTSYLETFFKKPLVFLEHYGDELQLIIRSFDYNNGGMCLINLEFIDNIEITKNCVGNNFLNYDIVFYYAPAKMDYNLKVVIK